MAGGKQSQTSAEQSKGRAEAHPASKGLEDEANERQEQQDRVQGHVQDLRVKFGANRNLNSAGAHGCPESPGRPILVAAVP
jgi:hypothetical protein